MMNAPLGRRCFFASAAAMAVIALAALIVGSGAIGGGTDATPPATEVSLSGSGGSNGWNISSVSVSLSASDGGAGSGVNYTRYNLGGAGWQNYTGNFTVTGDGVRVLEYYSVDLANNTEPTRNITIKIDTKDPVIDLEQSSGGVYGSSDVRLTWTSSDATSGLDYFEVYSDGALFDVLDNATTVEHVTNLVDGWHNVTVRAYDMAGNFADGKINFRVWANQGTALDETNLIVPMLIAVAVVAAILIIRWLVKKKRPESK